MYISIFNNFHKENVIHAISEENKSAYVCKCGEVIPKNHLFKKLLSAEDVERFKDDLLICECVK